MPVGTQATVKGLTLDNVRATGAQIVLANAYHLAMRPGDQVVRNFGGLHGFCGWQGPMLTDSGGFQVFSLAEFCKITEEGARFHSHIDGAKINITPERAIEIQEALGADIMMQFDHVIALPADKDRVQDAMERSLRWAKRCQNARRRDDQALFGIVQGGLEPDLRVASALALREMNFEGYAVGGLSVGEPPPDMYRMLDVTVPNLPADRVRYLMGVGKPEDLLEAVSRGVDLFDCVMPTRNGRNALVFTDAGPVRLKNARHTFDAAPLEQDCPCAACKHPRGYLRHLFMAGEMLGPILAAIHNLTYYQRLLTRARSAIANDVYPKFKQSMHSGWNQSNESDSNDDSTSAAGE